MSVIWIGLVIYAVVEAVAAAGRVRQKYQRTSKAKGFDSQPALLPEATGATSEAIETGTEADSEADRLGVPDRAGQDQAGQDQLGQEQAEQHQTQQHQTQQHQAEPDRVEQDRVELPEPPNLLVELHQSSGELQPPAELDLPLAVSVSVTDLAQAKSPVTISTLDLVPPSLALPEVESAKADRSQEPAHQSVLAEIAELGQASANVDTDAVSHFQRYLNHPDDVVRAATVFELGELAAKRPGAEAAEIRDLLMPLGQDPDPEVRSQVVVALTKIQALPF